MKTYGLLAAFAGGLLGLTALSSAQDTKPMEEVAVKPTEPRPTPTWTDPEFEKIAAMVTGSWKSASAVPTGEEGATSEIVLSAAPVVIKDLPNAMYCEIARADALRMPYRQEVLTFSRVGGKVRLTTFEFRRPRGDFGPAYNLWAAPEVFPDEVTRDDLIATLAFDVVPAGAGYTGKTPHSYPTGTGGAVEMTSEFKLARDKFELADRGMGADGKQVWGPAAGQLVTFNKFDPKLNVNRHPDGVVAITYPTELTGPVMTDTDSVSVEYTGYLMNGYMFDTSHTRGVPLPYRKGQLIQGWNMMMEDAQAGLERRLIIPAALAWGAGGRGQMIPPNSDVVFDIKVVKIEAAPATPPMMPTPPPVQGTQVKPAVPQPKPADPAHPHQHKDGEPHPK